MASKLSNGAEIATNYFTLDELNFIYILVKNKYSLYTYVHIAVKNKSYNINNLITSLSSLIFKS